MLKSWNVFASLINYFYNLAGNNFTTFKPFNITTTKKWQNQQITVKIVYGR